MLDMELPYDPAIPHLDIYLREVKTHINTEPLHSLIFLIKLPQIPTDQASYAHTPAFEFFGGDSLQFSSVQFSSVQLLSRVRLFATP